VNGSPPLGSQRDAFAVPAEIAYFNTATLSPHLHSAREAGEAALERRSRPWTITPADWFTDVERLRDRFARLIGADAEGVALVPATSYGFAVAARNLPLARGDRVLVLAEEYPSGVYTWQASTRATGAEIVTAVREPGQSWTDAVLAVLDERVRVVSVPHVHWTDGALVDLDAVSARTHEIGAHLVIDGSQSIGAFPFDVARLRPDFVTSVGYKWLLGQVGVSYLYVAEQHRDGVPIEQNWIARAGSEDFARLVDYRDDYQPGARRYDVGQHSEFELVPMALAALEQLCDWGVERIAAALADVTASVAATAAALGLDPMPADQRGPHMLGVRLPAAVREHVVPALAASNCYAAVRGEMLRLAPHLHVNDADIARLSDALARALESPGG
jgi:selenocysteine lyase/cysteine desulfurase